jgi:hypothetical protein
MIRQSLIAAAATLTSLSVFAGTLLIMVVDSGAPVA